MSSRRQSSFTGGRIGHRHACGAPLAGAGQRRVVIKTRIVRVKAGTRAPFGRICDKDSVTASPGRPGELYDASAAIAETERRSSNEALATAISFGAALGRTEFVMVSLIEGVEGLIAYPSGKGSGAITAFSQADGFLRIDALADQMPAGSEVKVTLFTPHVVCQICSSRAVIAPGSTL